MDRYEGESVAPKSLNEALKHIENGGVLYVSTVYKIIFISPAVLKKYQAINQWILKEEGNGYRMKTGKKSIYLFPGQLKYGFCKIQGLTRWDRYK